MEPSNILSRGSSDWMQRTKGIQLAFWAALLGSFLGVFVRLLDFYPTSLAFIGMVVLAVCYSIVMKIRHINPFDRSLIRQQGWKLFLRGFLNVMTTLLSIFALKTLPIGDAAVIGQTGPVYTSILAWLFLGESMSIYLILCLALTVGGTVLVAAPELFSSTPGPPVIPTNISAANLLPFAPEKYDNWPLLERLAPEFGVDLTKNNTISDIIALQGAYDNQLFLAVIAAVLSAFISAVDNVILRSMSAFVKSEVVIFYFAIEGSLLLFVPTIISGRFEIPLWGWQPLLILTAGAAYFIDIYLSIQAYKYEQASVLSLMRCVYSVFAFVWQVLIFHQKPATTALIGTFLVFIGVALVAYGKIREIRRGKLVPATSDDAVDSAAHAVAGEFFPQDNLHQDTSRTVPADAENYDTESSSEPGLQFETGRKRWWYSIFENVRHSSPGKYAREQYGALRTRLLSSSIAKLRKSQSSSDPASAIHNSSTNPSIAGPSVTTYGAI